MTAQDTLTRKDQADVVRAPQEETVFFRPATDVFETQDSVILRFDMPGVAKDQTDITVDKGLLTVTGHARQEQPGPCVYRETRIGDYQRQFTLTEDVEVDGITAEMQAGVLTIRIPKPENAKPKKIQIAASV
jgi:HSP20 family molecular chaperone IbpA